MGMSIKAFETENTINVSGRRAENVQQQNPQKTLFVGNTNLANDPIALRRKEAQEKAWNIVKNAWDSDKAIDDMIQGRKEHYAQMEKIKETSLFELSQIKEEKENLRNMYGVEADSKEQKDLELLQKAQEINAGVSDEELTEKERQYLAELYQGELTEYQSRVLEQNERAVDLKKQIADADKQMRDVTADLHSIEKERLKSNPMLEAKNAADDIMAVANEEIIGMLIQESKEHIDEKMEEAKEKAKKSMEEKEEKEEQLDELKLKRAVQEAMIEGTREAVEKARAIERQADAPDIEISEMVQMTQGIESSKNVEQSLEEIKNSMNLLEADLKGIKVDEEI